MFRLHASQFQVGHPHIPIITMDISSATNINSKLPLLPQTTAPTHKHLPRKWYRHLSFCRGKHYLLFDSSLFRLSLLGGVLIFYTCCWYCANYCGLSITFFLAASAAFLSALRSCCCTFYKQSISVAYVCAEQVIEHALVLQPPAFWPFGFFSV